MNAKNIFNDENAVSPIVATLVLVVVAIAGATAVGMIMGTFASDVSGDTNTGDLISSASTEIVVAGSTTVQPVSELIAKDYMGSNPGVKVTVQAGGSSAGIASAGMGIVDIGAASKFASDADKTKFEDLEEYVIGGSAVVVITNTDGAWTNNTITKSNLQLIYNNSQSYTVDSMGGKDLVIFHRQEGSGTEETFADYLYGDKEVDPTAKATDNVDTAIGNQGLLDEVADCDDVAIGFVDFGFADGADGITILSITDGSETYEATSKNVKAAVKDRLADSGSSDEYVYGLCRPLVYLTNGGESSTVKDFIDFAMSPAALEHFHTAGYYGITELQ